MAVPSSREKLIEYCKRKLGAPVIEINVSDEQLEDRVDEAIQYFQEYHADATHRGYLSHEMTEDDINNKYVTVPDDVHYVSQVFPFVSTASSSKSIFNLKYQFHLSDLVNISKFVGNLAYYEQMNQYLALLDQRLNGTSLIDFSRKQGRIYIHGHVEDKDLKVGDYLVAEVYTIISDNSIYNDLWLKEYTTALIKKQWGQNLSKYEGIQMPGGVTFNARQYIDDANEEIEKLQERMREEFMQPADFFVG